MSEDGSKRGRSDELPDSGEPYDLQYFARTHGISEAKVREIFARTGGKRESVVAEAKKLMN